MFSLFAIPVAFLEKEHKLDTYLNKIYRGIYGFYFMPLTNRESRIRRSSHLGTLGN